MFSLEFISKWVGKTHFDIIICGIINDKITDDECLKGITYLLDTSKNYMLGDDGFNIAITIADSFGKIKVSKYLKTLKNIYITKSDVSQTRSVDERLDII
jgi:hypothetical protein